MAGERNIEQDKTRIMIAYTILVFFVFINWTVLDRLYPTDLDDGVMEEKYTEQEVLVS